MLRLKEESLKEPVSKAKTDKKRRKSNENIKYTKY